LKFSFPLFLIFMAALSGLTACSSGGGSASCSLGTGASISVTGQITFDRVPLDSASGALDFANTSTEPAQGVTVQAVCNSAISSATTDANGHYSLSVPAGTNGVLVRAKAEMLKTGTPAWDVTVLDETQTGDVVFVMDGSPFNVVNSPLVRNLHAASGFDGLNYTTSRVAGPFAMLDTIRKAQNLVLSVNASSIFPPLKVKWSEVSTTGTFYTNNTISVLGSLADTDEYDEHVIAHEWGHYFQDAFSRDDSIGGQHSQGNVLDIRVAFSEGFGNAFSAMVMGDSVYKDSQSVLFRTGFTIDVESNSCPNEGWYNECSVQSVLFDFFDDDSETSDVFNLGFTEIYDVMVNDMPNSPALTSIFNFITPFKAKSSVVGTDVDTLLNAQLIDQITDDFGSGVTSLDADVAGTDVVPAFKTGDLTTGFNVCSTGGNGGYNGLGVNRFITFTSPATDRFTFNAVRTSGITQSDPDIYIYQNGIPLGGGESTVANSETFNVNLVTGVEYVLQVLEFTYSNPDYNPDAVGAINETCFTISRT